MNTPYDTPSRVEDSESWREQALCAQTDPEAFFPQKGGSTRYAKKICASCDVREQCLAYALETGQREGIWGGLSERERAKIRTAGRTQSSVCANGHPWNTATTYITPAGRRKCRQCQRERKARAA